MAFPPERVFDTDRLLTALEALRSGRVTRGVVARAKGIFRTTAGWHVHEIAGGRLSTAATQWRRDTRVDVILREPEEEDFLEWERALEGALVPTEAPLLTLDDGAGRMRAFDPRGFAALPLSPPLPLPPSEKNLSSDLAEGPAFRLGDVMEFAGIARPAGWMWIVMDAGLFGVGGPRHVLENGIVFPENGGFRYVLPEEAARGAEDEVDACRDLSNVCAVRLADPPGTPAEEEAR